MANVLILWVSDDGVVPHRIFAILVHPKVQRGHVYLPDLLSHDLISSVMKGGCVGTSSEEGIAGFQRLDEMERGQELLEGLVGLDLSVPVAFLLDDHAIPSGNPLVCLDASGHVEFRKCAVGMELGPLIAFWRTTQAPVLQTNMEFIHGISESIVAITVHAHFTPIGRVINAVRRRGSIGRKIGSLKTMFLPCQPVEGFGRLVRARAMLTTRGFHCN